jgi:protein-disulfide isomerase
VLKLAREAQLDEEPFAACLDSEKAKARVLKDIQEGIKAGVKGTPSIFINGKRLPRPTEFLQAVELESQRLGLGPMPQPQAQGHGPHDGHGH